MVDPVDLYDSHYGNLESDAHRAVRRGTYDEDLGQSSWITGGEARECFTLLRLAPESRVLEIACGSGGVARLMARETGAAVVGVDANEHGISSAARLATREGLDDLVEFHVADAARPLKFDQESFDAVFCNDSINHLPDRLGVLSDWERLLAPGGRVLFTDPILVTGQLSNEEIAIRSSIGFFLFTPPGFNERALAASGFRLIEVRDVTASVVDVAKRWHDARSRLQKELTRVEGEERYASLQRFLGVVHRLAAEARLSRFLYLAEKP